jgi:hypothetical protein
MGDYDFVDDGLDWVWVDDKETNNLALLAI